MSKKIEHLQLVDEVFAVVRKDKILKPLFQKQDCKELIDIYLQTVINHLKEENSVVLKGLGIAEIRTNSRTICWNIKKKEKITIKPRKKVKLKTSQGLTKYLLDK